MDNLLGLGIALLVGLGLGYLLAKLIRGKPAQIEESPEPTTDWEFARQSDPAYDLAVFTYTHALNQKQSSELLLSYSRHEPELPSRIDYFERVYAMIEIFWRLIRGKKIDIRKLQALLDTRQLT